MMNLDGIPVYKKFDYVPPQITGDIEKQCETLIVGGGPVGLTLALDLAKRGRPVTVLNAMDRIAAGSKAICFAKRTLDIWSRLGVAERMIDKGVIWNVGKVFWKAEQDPLFQFDMLPVKNQKNPGFINLQQYYAEEFLLEELLKYDNVDIRWRHEVVDLQQLESGVRVTVETLDGQYQLETQYLLACDGNRSPVRNLMGLDFEGRVFEDNFLIADVKFKQPFPSERRFWFEPDFFYGASVLMHKQPDDVWRLDFQLGWDIDREAAIKEENVDPLVQSVIGEGVDYEYEWLSIYTFQCRRMSRFVHDRVVFVGDSAHLVSPFGARGCNGGVADADNLAWKLDLILSGKAGAGLLETYNEEAVITADENILNSSRATDFMTPKSEMSKIFRDSVLSLAREHEFAKPMINSGRLSAPVNYRKSSLNAVSDEFTGGLAPGHVCVDAPVKFNNQADWFLNHIGDTFSLVYFAQEKALQNEDLQALVDMGLKIIVVDKEPAQSGSEIYELLVDVGILAERYAATEGVLYLIRPDQYVLGRWRSFKPELIKEALSNAELLI